MPQTQASPWDAYLSEYADLARETRLTQEAFYLVYFWSKRSAQPVLQSSHTPDTSTSDDSGTLVDRSTDISTDKIAGTLTDDAMHVDEVVKTDDATQLDAVVNATTCVETHKDASSDVEFVDMRASQCVGNTARPTSLPSTLARREERPSAEVKEWCDVANLLFRLVRQAPDCPTAILREVYRNVHSAAKCEPDSTTPQEDWLLDEQRMTMQNEDMKTCRMIHALLPYLSANCSALTLVTFSVLLRHRDINRRTLEMTGGGSDLDALCKSARIRAIRFEADKALYMASALRPGNFFGALLLSYLVPDKQTLEALDAGVFAKFVTIFTRCIPSIHHLLPRSLQKSKVWAKTIVPCLDFILFDLVGILDTLHSSAANTYYQHLPLVVQQLLPYSDIKNDVSKTLCVSAPLGLQRSVSISWPDATLLHDQFVDELADEQLLPEQGVHRCMHGILVDNRWFTKAQHTRRQVQHSRNYYAFAMLLQTIASRTARSKDADLREIIVKDLPFGKTEDAREFGHYMLPEPREGWSPLTLEEWKKIPVRYRPFFPSLSVETVPNDRDFLVKQAIKLVLAKDVDVKHPIDSSPLLHVHIETGQKEYFVEVVKKRVRYKR